MSKSYQIGESSTAREHYQRNFQGLELDPRLTQKRGSALLRIANSLGILMDNIRHKVVSSISSKNEK